MNMKNMAAMALSALLCLTTTGVMAAQTTYKVSVKEGTEDASNWQGKAGEGDYQALPLEGVAAGTAVTVKYNGTKKVKSVKAVKVKRAATVTAPTAVAASLTYSGSAQTLFSAGSTTGGTMKYKVTTTNSKPESTADFKTTIDQGTNAGTYYLWYYVDGGDNYISTDVNGTAVTKAIGKATASVTAPTAKTGVKAGQNVAIVNAGTATGGTMMYKVTTANTKPTSTDGFSATVPTAEGLTAGTYYVWYYVEGDASHTDSEISATGIEVTIAAAGHALSASVVGEIVCSDGLAYAAADKDKLPQGVTAVAKICYVSGSHGLALALADEGKMNWSTAMTTAAAHTPAITGGTWKLATKQEWENMITAAGSYTALRDGFSSVGGSNLQSDSGYWSSTESSGYVWVFAFGGSGNSYTNGNAYGGIYVRACLAF